MLYKNDKNVLLAIIGMKNAPKDVVNVIDTIYINNQVINSPLNAPSIIPIKEVAPCTTGTSCTILIIVYTTKQIILAIRNAMRHAIPLIIYVDIVSDMPCTTLFLRVVACCVTLLDTSLADERILVTNCRLPSFG